MEWYQHPVVHAMILTVGTAVVLDIQAWKSWEDAAFNWKTASWRWVQAAFIGAAGGFGLNVVTG